MDLEGKRLSLNRSTFSLVYQIHKPSNRRAPLPQWKSQNPFRIHSCSRATFDLFTVHEKVRLHMESIRPKFSFVMAHCEQRRERNTFNTLHFCDAPSTVVHVGSYYAKTKIDTFIFNISLLWVYGRLKKMLLGFMTSKLSLLMMFIETLLLWFFFFHSCYWTIIWTLWHAASSTQTWVVCSQFWHFEICPSELN